MKTTVYLDASDYRRLKTLAAAAGQPAAELIRVAVSEYVRARGLARRPASLGAGHSADPRLAERAEELLERFGEDG